MSSKLTIRSMTPQQVQDSMARAGLVSVPEWQHPIMMLALIQQIFRQNTLYQISRESRDGIIAAASRHFGDGQQWHHVQEVFELFNFGVDEDRLDAMLSVINSFFASLVEVFDVDGAWRFVNAYFDGVVSGYQVVFDKSEPVATLRKVKDEPGLNEWVPHYGLWVMRALESRVDRAAAEQYTAYAVHLPETHDIRVAADGFMRVMMERPNDDAASTGSPLDSGITARILPRSPWLRQPPAAELVMGDPSNQGQTWADGQLGMLRALPAPVYPLDGYTTAQLATLAPIQRHGAPREGYTHSGLDLAVPQGVDVLALWPGKVAAVQRGEMPRTRPTDKTDARGNFVGLTHEFDVSGQKYRVSTEYYHLASVPDKLKSGAKLERGAAVAARDVIGQVGSTGNSSGPHLHLDIRVGLVDGSGRSSRRWTLDPQLVLESGLVAAMRSAGVPMGGAGAPHLAIPALALTAIAGGRQRVSMGMPGGLLKEYEAQTRAFFDSLQKQATQAAQTAAEAVKKVEPVAKKIGAAGFDAFAPGTPGRSALELAYTSVGLPGGIMGGVLDALHAAYDGAAGTGDARRTSALEGLDQRLAGQELTEEQRAQLLALANRAYSQIKT